MKKIVVCLIGPTAVGKTEIALKLAKRIDAEIISCDSMQVYKGVGIATSKPLKKQRKEVPHHLVDIKSPSREYNAACFKNSAQKIINDIHRRDRLPLIVGGTGLYFRALIDGLFTGPGKNSNLRQKFYRQAKRYGTSYLYRKLKNKDPKSARSIHPHDLRRIVRALEVYESIGKPISKLKEKTQGVRNRYDLRIFGLRRPRGQLYARIERRVNKMFKRGLVAEIKGLAQGKLSKTAKSLLGYKEVMAFLKGNCSCDEARRLLKRNTRRYAKRQISWFRREKEVKWMEVGPKDTPELITERILGELPNVENRQR